MKTNFLAAVDLETVKATNQVDKGTVETYINNEVKTNRFKNLSNASIDEIVTKAETKNTKENTKWAVRVFEGTFYPCKDLIKLTYTVRSFASPSSYLLQITNTAKRRQKCTHFFRALAASCVLYNRTEHSQGFFIC